MKKWTVLDGELAALCNSQSAIPVQRMLCKPRQDRKVAAVAEIFLVLQINLT